MLEIMQIKLASTANSLQAEGARLPSPHPLWRQAFESMLRGALGDRPRLDISFPVHTLLEGGVGV